MKKYLFNIRSFQPDIALLLLRVASGGIMAYSHGWGKAQKLLSGDMAFADPIGIGQEASLVLTVFAELVCGVLLALGLFTRAALIPLIVTMAVAVFIIHAPDPLADKEFAILYLVPYVALLFFGPGKFSADRFMK